MTKVIKTIYISLSSRGNFSCLTTSCHSV